jgi:methionyl-tRNA synthetase
MTSYSDGGIEAVGIVGPMARPFSLTTPIYYPNDAPHIGHAYTTVNGDVLTRWRKLWDDDIVYLTGADEHGLNIARAAEAQGLPAQEFVDQTSPTFREAWKLLDIFRRGVSAPSVS